jgi:hypothetical protein
MKASKNWHMRTPALRALSKAIRADIRAEEFRLKDGDRVMELKRHWFGRVGYF